MAVVSERAFVPPGSFGLRPPPRRTFANDTMQPFASSFEPALSEHLHARELMQLAGTIAAQGPAIIRHAQRVSSTAMAEYFAASRCRLDRWARALRNLTPPPNQKVPLHAATSARANLEEVLLSEPLMRVWTTVMTGYDRRRGQTVVEPVVRNIFRGHVDSRRRWLQLLVDDAVFAAGDAALLNRLRRRVDRWIDFLVANLQHSEQGRRCFDTTEFAVDAKRCCDFAADLTQRLGQPTGNQAWSLAFSALKTGFSRGTLPLSPNADLHYRVAASVVASFDATCFDATGPFGSVWRSRVFHNAADAVEMIDELLDRCDRPFFEAPSHTA